MADDCPRWSPSGDLRHDRMEGQSSGPAATVAEIPGGYGVELDGPAREDPRQGPLAVPTAPCGRGGGMGRAGGHRPDTMPVTRAANAAIDKVCRTAAVAGDDRRLWRQRPAVLSRRSPGGAGPRGRPRPGIRCSTGRPVLRRAPSAPWPGVMHVPQDPDRRLQRCTARACDMDAFALTALHDLVVSCRDRSSSGFAAMHGRRRIGRGSGTCRGSTRPGRRSNGASTTRPAQRPKRSRIGFRAAKRFHDLATGEIDRILAFARLVKRPPPRIVFRDPGLDGSE